MKDEFLQNDISRRPMKNLANSFKMISLALAFVPPQNVIEEFVRIKESASDVLDGKKYPQFYYFIRYFFILRENKIAQQPYTRKYRER